jgi:hypothetical protein
MKTLFTMKSKNQKLSRPIFKAYKSLFESLDWSFDENGSHPAEQLALLKSIAHSLNSNEHNKL